MKLLWSVLLAAALLSGCNSSNLSAGDSKTGEAAVTSQPAGNDLIDTQNTSYLQYSLNEAKGWKLKIMGQGMSKADNILYKTNDGGKSWREISNSSTGKLPGETLSDLLFTSNERGWLTVNSPRNGFIGLFQTEDGGKTWSHTNVEGSSDAIYTVHVPVFFSSTTYGVLRVQDNESMKESSLFFVTKDSGGTWEAISNEQTGQWNSLKWTITEDQDKSIWEVQINDKTWSYNGRQWTSGQ
jgi:photosystem II stability/assembly factor-like uncharacterized protein